MHTNGEVVHELFPEKFWKRLGRLPSVGGSTSIADEPVLVGWLVRQQPIHYLITEADAVLANNYGLYGGIKIDRANGRVTRLMGQHSNKYGLDAMLIQGVQLDKMCGFSRYTVGECFDKFHWDRSILNEQVARQDS